MIKSLERSITAAEPFDAVANTYDDTFSNSLIGRAQRQAVWATTDRAFQSGQRILELNCGTGIDAVHLATRGIDVVACDSSSRMIEVAQRRLTASSVRGAVDFRCIRTEEITLLEDEGTYDGILSNFAGLNCISDLVPVARNLARLVKPGGKAVLCFFGRLCLWEICFYLVRCNFKNAFRRLRRTDCVVALSSGSKVIVRYSSIHSLRRAFSKHFRLEHWTGVGIAVPPSYVEYLAVRNPRLFGLASTTDSWLGRCPGVRALADHVVLTFERCRQ